MKINEKYREKKRGETEKTQCSDLFRFLVPLQLNIPKSVCFAKNSNKKTIVARATHIHFKISTH